MKKLFFLPLLFLSLLIQAQIKPYYLRGYDTVYFIYSGFPASVTGNTELVLFNSTRSVPYFLKNIGGGRTQFVQPVIADIAGLQAALNGMVPATRTITINSTTYDLSANRSWTVTADTSGGLLSNYQTALNQRIRWSDTAGLFNDYRTAINARLRWADTATLFQDYRSAINARIRWTDTATLFNDYRTAIALRVRWTDTSTLFNDYRSAINARIRTSDTSTLFTDYRNAINARVRWADTATLFNDYRTAINARIKISDTATFFTDYRNAINARVRWADTATLFNDYRTAINARIRYSDSATMLSTYQTALNLRQNKGLTASKGLIIGDSESAAGWGGTRLDSLILTGSDTTIGNTITNQAVGGHTILQQQTAYLADANRALYDWVIVHIGLNDIWNYSESAATALGRYQTLINNIRSNSPKATIIVAAMQPVRKAYFNSFSNANALTAYAKWYQMNLAIMGVGSNKITSVDYRVDEHSKALGDSLGNLVSIYNVGDDIHTNTRGRQVVAGFFRKALNQAGFLNNRSFPFPDAYLNFSDSNVVELKVKYLQAGNIRLTDVPGSASVADSVSYFNRSTKQFEMRAMPTISGGTGDVVAAGNNDLSGNNRITSAGSLAFHNQADMTTNTEYALFDWVSNVYTIDVGKTGTGTNRNMELKANGAVITIGNHPVAGGALDINKTGAFLNTYSVRGSNTLSSGIFSASAIYPTINQSGTATWVMDFKAPYIQSSGGTDNYFARYTTSGSANAGGPYTFIYHIKANGDIWTAGSADIDGNLNVDGTVTFGNVSNTEIGYLDGVTSGIQSQFSGKQASLVSGTNIKTINSNSLLGSGNIDVAAATHSHTYSDITGNAAAVTFSPVAGPTYAQGKLAYDSNNESLVFFNNESDVALQIGQESWIKVYNTTGSTIANGKAVYISGSHTDGTPLIALAQANSASTTIVAGVSTHSIENNTYGYITCIGVVNGMNTASFTAGQTIFLSSSSAGDFTTTVPSAPNYRYRVGIVTKSDASAGAIHVTPSTADIGWGTANQVRQMNSTATGQTWANTTQTTFITADVANSTTSYADVTGLSFPVTSGKTYRFKFTAWYSSAATTTGARWSINGPTSTEMDYYAQMDTQTGLVFTSGVTSYNSTGIGFSADSKTTSNRGVVEGMITVSASGTIILRFASEVASSAITFRQGWVEFTEMP